MTREIDSRLIKRKIKLIQEDLLNLKEIEPYSEKEIAGDFFKYRTVERLLEVIIMRAVDVNSHLITRLGTGQEKVRGYMDTFIVLGEMKILPLKFANNLALSADFRNFLAHEYDEVDMSELHKAIPLALREFKKYCQFILDF
jgi:uncharacterized protein YutE (UPF0331/DUF86 family)